MKVRLRLPDRTPTGMLYDTVTARDFASLLPLTLEDYAKTEKISDLPRKLTGKARRRGPTLPSGTSPTTPRGGTSPCSTRTSATRTG